MLLFKAVKAGQNWRIKLLAERHIRRAVKTARKRGDAAAAIESEHARSLGGERAEEEAAKEAEKAALEAKLREEKRLAAVAAENFLNDAAEEDASAAAADFAFDACSAALQVRRRGCVRGVGVGWRVRGGGGGGGFDDAENQRVRRDRWRRGWNVDQ